MAEWLRCGLQIRAPWFDSKHGLQDCDDIVPSNAGIKHLAQKGQNSFVTSFVQSGPKATDYRRLTPAPHARPHRETHQTVLQPDHHRRRAQEVLRK